MKIKRLVLLSLGVLGASMPFGAYAVNPIMPMVQQEQLQQDREVQQERNLRLDTERIETVVNEPAPIDVPSDQNGASFFIHHIQLDGVPKEFATVTVLCSFLRAILCKKANSLGTPSN